MSWLLALPIALLAIAQWVEHRERRAAVKAQADEAKGYQVASNQRHNTLMSMLREMGKDVGWDDSKARTMALDPDVIRELRKETGPR